MNLTTALNLIEQQTCERDRNRMQAVEAQWKEFGEIRDKNLLFHIGFSSPEFLNTLLAAHPAKQVHDSVENVERAFYILTQSHRALVDLYGVFHSRLVHQIYEGNDSKAQLSEATKELYTYSCAAISLVQAYRHLVSNNAEFESKYENLRQEIFGNNQIVRFISDLRRNNNHIFILTANPHYTITNKFDGKSNVKSGIRFDKNRILNGDWSSESKSFMSTRSSLDVVELVSEHFELALRFKKLVLFRTGINSNCAYRDILRILHVKEIIGKKVWLGIVLQQAVAKKLNPYEYLADWFSEAELKNIYAFPDHTKEQLEYMISLRDPFGFCDYHTRKELYQLFSVPLDLLPIEPPDRAIVGYEI